MEILTPPTLFIQCHLANTNTHTHTHTDLCVCVRGRERERERERERGIASKREKPDTKYISTIM